MILRILLPIQLKIYFKIIGKSVFWQISCFVFKELIILVSGVIVAAGKGTRMGASENKVFLKIDDKTVIKHTIDKFLEADKIDEIILVTGKDDIKRCEELIKTSIKPVKVICGGKTRQESVFNGITAASGDIVCIHDGARALIKTDKINEVISVCMECEAAALGVKAKDTIKIVDENGFIKSTPNRDFTYQIQTPQVFLKNIIIKAHNEFKDVSVTDDCMLVEMLGVPVKIVEGSYENIKLTTPDDLINARAILDKRKGE